MVGAFLVTVSKFSFVCLNFFSHNRTSSSSPLHLVSTPGLGAWQLDGRNLAHQAGFGQSHLPSRRVSGRDHRPRVRSSAAHDENGRAAKHRGKFDARVL